MIDRERITGFIEEHRIHLVIALGSLLVFLVIMLIAGMISDSSRKEQLRREQDEAQRLSLSPDELWFPEKPFPVPGVQLFRTTPPFWSADQIELWYNTPDAAMLDGIREPARRQIDDLLESVP